MRIVVFSLIALSSACTDSPEDAQALPSGESTFTGSGSVNSMDFDFDLTLNNTGGDITGDITVRDTPDGPAIIGEGTYAMTGTYEPTSGLLALAPGDWIDVPDLEIEMPGFLGSFDPETNVLSGDVSDYAEGDDNVLRGGPVSLDLVTGDGDPLVPGDAAMTLPEGEVLVFTGTIACTGVSREARAELTYDGEGAVSGSLTYGGPTLDTGNTFDVTGVHNPTTGGITLVPGLYTEVNGDSFLTFYIDGAFDPADDSFTGGGRTAIGPCAISDGWDVSL